MGDRSRSGLRDLQLSWSTQAALRVLRTWARTDQLSTANRSITIDWFFIPAYLVAIGGMCLWGSRSIKWDLWGALGRVAAALVAVAALLDVVENIGMRRMISTGDADPAVLVSAVSSAKLVLVVLGILYGLTAAANRTAVPRRR